MHTDSTTINFTIEDASFQCCNTVSLETHRMCHTGFLNTKILAS